MASKSFLQRLHAKMYAGSWTNPLFADPKVKERAFERSKYALYTALAVVSGVTFFSTLFWFGTQERFAIHEVEVSGMRSLANAYLERDILHSLKECSAFTVDCLYTWNMGHAEIVSVLQEKYPLEEVSLTLEGKKLHVQVREAVTMIPVRIGHDIWFATQTGVLQAVATSEEIQAGIIIPPESYSEIDVSQLHAAGEVGMQVESKDLFENIAAYRKALSMNGIGIERFTVTKDRGRIEARTLGGYDVFFTPWEDPGVQIRRLVKVLAEATPQSYVDIRFGERIYLK
jgi:hypothetical protein